MWLFMTHWNDIQKKLQELEDAYKEKYGRLADDPLEPLGDSPEAGPLDKKAMEEKEAKEEAQEAQEAQEAVLHWRCFVDFIQTYLKNLLGLRNCIAESKLEKISFDNLWHLFSPGDMVLGQEPFDQHLPQAYQVFSVTKPAQIEGIWQSFRLQRSNPGGRNSLKPQCFYLDYDGSTIGSREETVYIKPYLGEKKITELDFYPKTATTPAATVLSNLAMATVPTTA
jgi:hypothetical protein